MTAIRNILGFFLSLRTALWLLGIMLLLMFAGALIMPGRQEFQALHGTPLFSWLRTQPLSITWWMWGLIGLLAVLAANTLFCSVESVLKKRKVTQWLLIIAPQVIHIGFLFVLLAHLMSAQGARQSQAAVWEGSVVALPGSTMTLKVRDINIILDYYGYIRDWEVDVEYLAAGKALHQDRIMPNNPSVRQGFNVTVKDLRARPPQAVLLQINREPGAAWALAGGILFMIGITTLVVLRIRMER
ncbi:MAG: hypothetical protein JSU90_13310 [Nitrospiraceae bacterium]|nr:MAG: hypothetical protein JSU90_13310 [Nitrospiraceae bacterium]